MTFKRLFSICDTILTCLIRTCHISTFAEMPKSYFYLRSLFFKDLFIFTILHTLHTYFTRVIEAINCTVTIHVIDFKVFSTSLIFQIFFLFFLIISIVNQNINWDFGEFYIQ